MTTSIDETTTTDLSLPVISMTDEARVIVSDALASEPDPETMALWLEVRAVEAGNFTYDLYFQAPKIPCQRLMA